MEEETTQPSPPIKTISDLCAEKAARRKPPRMITSFTFRYIIPQQFIMNVIERVGIPQYKRYIIDYSSYKKLNDDFIRNKFCDIIRPFLRKKFRFLVQKHEFTYDNFTRLLRNLCRQHNIHFFFVYTRCSNKKTTSVYGVGLIPPNQKRHSFLSIQPTYYDYYQYDNE
jgi:hypothetical protein